MLQVLVESRAMRQQRGSWTVASVAIHASILIAAVAITARAAPELARPAQIEEIVYVAPAPASAAAPAPLAPIPSELFARPSITLPPVAMPTFTNPSTDILSRVIGELTTVSSGFVIGNQPGTGVAPGGIHTAGNVDRIVAALPGNASPAYPARLSSAGVEGEVMVRFVVDTTGRVEAPSIEILAASHALFGDAVKQWLRQTRYSPAIAGGRPVRQLVQQRVGFTLTR